MRVPSSLLTRFTLITAIVTAFVAVGLGWLLSRQMTDQALENAAKDANRIVTSLVTTQVTPDDFATPTPARVAAWHERFGHLVGGTDIVRVKVWNALGQVVYSDDPALVGQIFPLEANEELREALDGHLAMELSGLEKSENVTERPHGRLLEIYVPVVPPGTSRVAGAYEVYLTATAVQAKIFAIRRLVWGGSAAAFSLLYASLFLLVRRASRQLTRQQEVLRASEERFRELFENANDIVFTLDLAGNFTSVNGAGERLAGYTRDKICGMSIFQVVVPEQLEAVREMLDKNVTGTVPSTSDLEITTRDGLRVALEVSTRLISREGKPVGVQGIARDITERKRAEEEIQRQHEALYQSEKLAAMGQLLAGVAHELNNPLSVLTGQALLLQEALGDGPLGERADKIAKAAERSSRIVRNFLALARHRPPERQKVRLNRVVEEAVELFAYELRVDNVDVTLDLAPDLPILWADPHQLQQVVLNLASNAHQAMRQSSPPRRLTLSTRFDSGSGRISLDVADTGPGIPPEIRSRIFEAFFTTKPPGQGTGLGLSLCQGIIEGHGGTILVENGRGRGAIFRVELPGAAPPVAEAEARPAQPEPAIRGKRILVVDDEPEVANVLVDLLKLDDHQAATAANGALALDTLRKQTYDLILSDIKMPELDGPGLYRKLMRRHPEMLHRFIFLTGDMLSPETRAFVERTGAPMISKPFAIDEIRQSVERALRVEAAEPAQRPPRAKGFFMTG